MKKIALEFEDKDRLSYPVGEDMLSAINYINKVIDKIKENNLFTDVQNITLWCRGSSGALLSALFSAQLIQMGITVRIVHVRKDGESSHGDSYRIIDQKEIKDSYNIIIDDFISCGYTVQAIYEKFIKYNPTCCIHMLVVQSITLSNCINFVPKCLITDGNSLNKIS